MPSALLFHEPSPERFAAFCEFHKANPGVYVLFRRFADDARAAGRSRFGARLIGERLRWYVQVETKGGDDFKFNNNHWPYYARLLMLKEPSFAGFFERRDGRFDATDSMLSALSVPDERAEGAA